MASRLWILANFSRKLRFNLFWIIFFPIVLFDKGFHIYITSYLIDPDFQTTPTLPSVNVSHSFVKNNCCHKIASLSSLRCDVKCGRYLRSNICNHISTQSFICLSFIWTGLLSHLIYFRFFHLHATTGTTRWQLT